MGSDKGRRTPIARIAGRRAVKKKSATTPGIDQRLRQEDGAIPSEAGDLSDSQYLALLKSLKELIGPDFDRLGFDRLDDLIQEGYDFFRRDPAAACGPWLEAWGEFLALSEVHGLRTLEDFDERFEGTQCVFNWIQDFDSTLREAGYRDPVYHRHRMEISERLLLGFRLNDSLLRENTRRALAESCFAAGDPARGDALFEQWLKADPRWGWGWIGWSDQYALFSLPANRDPEKGEILLKRGLAVKRVRDRADIIERLSTFHQDMAQFAATAAPSREDASAKRRGKASGHVLSIKTRIDFGE